MLIFTPVFIKSSLQHFWYICRVFSYILTTTSIKHNFLKPFSKFLQNKKHLQMFNKIVFLNIIYFHLIIARWFSAVIKTITHKRCEQFVKKNIHPNLTWKNKRFFCTLFIPLVNLNLPHFNLRHSNSVPKELT